MEEKSRPPAFDADELVTLLQSGTHADWRQFRDRDASFPLGKNGAGAHWILEAAAIGSAECVRWCIEMGADLDLVDEAGMTVLHACIERTDAPRKHEVLAELIAAGADLDLIGYNGWAPLHVAAVRGDFQAAALLLAAGADKHVQTPIDSRTTPAEEALASGHKDLALLIRNYRRPS